MTTDLLQANHTAGIDELPDSAPLLADHAALRARWEEDGVLYFKNVIDQDTIAAVRHEYLARLKDVGVVAPDQAEPVWSGVKRIDGKLARPVADATWRGLVSSPSFDAVVRKFLGEAPAWVPIVVHRAAPPADKATIGPDNFKAGHQDGVYNYGIDFITCWVPLMEIDEEVGGLAVVPGSHRADHYGKHAGPSGVNRTGVFPESAWRRPDYKPGDLLMFHSMTAHAGLPNRSDKIRLSVDIRFLPGSLPKPIVGSVLGYDGTIVRMQAESGEALNFIADDATVVRGPKGTPVAGEARTGVLFPGAAIIAVPDTSGRAKLVRSVSRKYLDLPADWFAELPPNWVR
jgi:ectoine hydroxylase-related dioxygenase (phytanoyl-CoA dioxygenase family)